MQEEASCNVLPWSQHLLGCPALVALHTGAITSLSSICHHRPCNFMKDPSMKAKFFETEFRGNTMQQ